MEISFSEYEKMQRYLDDAMTQEEAAAFLLEVEKSPALKEHLLLERNIYNALTAKEADEITQKMGYTDADFKAQPTEEDKAMFARLGIKTSKAEEPVVAPIKIERINKRKWLALAAASVVLIIAASIWLYINHKKNTNQPFVKNKNDSSKENLVVKPPDSSTQKNKDVQHKPVDLLVLAIAFYEKDDVPTNKPQLLAQAFDDYSDGEYATLQRLDIDKLPKGRGNDDDSVLIKSLGHYYKGISYIETKQNALALENFQWVVGNAKDGVLKTKALYYQALVYLKMKDKSSAIPLLEKVTTLLPATKYAKKAAALLSAITD